MRDVVILGCGSVARYVIDNLRGSREYRARGLVDVGQGKMGGQVINGVTVIGTIDDFQNHSPPASCLVIAAVGNPAKKRSVAARAQALGYRFFNSIHPLAYVSMDARVGEGTIINAQASVMPNAEIGRHCHIHSQCVIEHDVVLEDFVNIAPAAVLAGRVRVGEGSCVFTGAKVIPDIRIGKNAIIGAGAVVIRDVPDDVTVVGVPAHSIKGR